MALSTHEQRSRDLDELHERDEAHDALAREAAAEVRAKMRQLAFHLGALVAKSGIRDAETAAQLDAALCRIEKDETIGDYLHDGVTSDVRWRLDL